jgi:hypothetical protein
VSLRRTIIVHTRLAGHMARVAAARAGESTSSGESASAGATGTPMTSKLSITIEEIWRCPTLLQPIPAKCCARIF